MPKKIIVPDSDFWDEERERFVVIKGTTLTVEHSLVSISKWEEKWHKPFLRSQEEGLTKEEERDYYYFMTIGNRPERSFYDDIPPSTIREIQDYMNNPMTATWFSDRSATRKTKVARKGEVITNEIVYYWMFKCQIPMEAEKWHFNKLMTLIRVFNIKDSSDDKSNKMSTNEIYAHNRSVRDRNRALLAAEKEKNK